MKLLIPLQKLYVPQSPLQGRRGELLAAAHLGFNAQCGMRHGT
jgi:hypothetical protein